jgi:S1-C subfamily serine protease
MGELVPGQRVGLGKGFVSFQLEGPRLAQLNRELGAMLVALDPARRLAPAFAPLDIGAREMRPGASYAATGALELDLAAIPPSVDRLLLVLHLLRGPGQGISFRDFDSIAVLLGEHRFTLDLASRGEAALIMVEVYRRGDEWRVTASGQGFVGGLNAMRSALNIDIPVPHYPDRGRNDGGGGHSDPFDRRRPPPPPGSTFSGSGFAVDDRHILTNAHVIDGAVKIDVASDKLTAPAEIIFADPRNDIALLRVDRSLGTAARFRDPADLHLGEDIVVLGFPLQGLLGSGPQATGGNVSALCGIGNDTSVMQFSAPIASGNSGGPILDQSGLVVGLVHSSLNMERLREGGSNAENVNFGAKAAVVRAFLGTVGIDPMLAAHAATRSRAEIVREARSYIYRIRCEA